MVEPLSVVGIGIVALRKEDKVGSKLRITEESFSALQDVAEIHFECLPAYNDLLAGESWARVR